jgi:ribonuclease HI
MKTLKLEHALAQKVIAGKKTSTWRLFDDKDLSVNDTVLLIDKVNPKDPSSWKAIGTAHINQVVQRRLGDASGADMDGHASREQMLATFQRYYGPDVDWDTPVKIISFQFSPHIPTEQPPTVVHEADKLIIYADGGSRGNPGPSASGFVIYDDQQRVLVNRGVYLGVTTNNQAEYTALKQALEEARSLGAHNVHVYMDSLLVINQMRGLFKVKNRDLWPLHDAVKQLCNDFTRVDFTQIPRELNKAADAAVNSALDAHQAEQGRQP